jgi:hypothetical protein
VYRLTSGYIRATGETAATATTATTIILPVVSMDDVLKGGEPSGKEEA